MWDSYSYKKIDLAVEKLEKAEKERKENSKK
jgi:hypothetical protein